MQKHSLIQALLPTQNRSIMQKLFENKKINEIITQIRSKSLSVFGFNLGERTFVSSQIDAPLCYITAETDKLEIIKKQFESLGKKVAVLDCASDDFCLHILEFGSGGLENQSAIFKAIRGEIDVLVITAETLATRFVPRALWERNKLVLRIGDDIEPALLGEKLIKRGYKRVESIDGVGQWARRGDVVDIFPINSQLPVRLHFFDTQIEKISSFNVLTQYSIDKIEEINLCPNGFELEEIERTEICESINSQIATMKKLAGKAKSPSDFEANLGAFSHAIELINSHLPREAWNFVSCFTESILLPKLLANFTFIIDQPRAVFNALDAHVEVCKQNVEAGIKSGQLCLLHKNSVLDLDELKAELSKCRALSFQSLMTQNKFFSPDMVLNFATLPVPKLGRNYEEYDSNLKEFLGNGYEVIATAGDATQAGDLAEKLGRYVAVEQIASLDDIRSNRVNIFVHSLQLGACFVTDKLLVLGSQDSHFERVKTKWDKQMVSVTDTFTLPEQGDYVVHAIHGIGVCEGVTQLSVGGAKRDYVVVSYKNNDRLYVPTEQLDMLGRYIGGDKTPALSSIGGTAFEKVKQRVRESVKELAFDLLKLYRAREQSKGIVMQVDDDTMREFETSFPFTPTPDQEKAFNDVYTDLSSGKIMDRLVVGDVGYGKTEVALRGAFVAVMSGYQVALIVPTTILSEQHFNNFNSRLKNYGINVKCLNRFRTTKEQKQIVEDVKSGKVNILIGTHRALSSDVAFDNLGLLILDEEQRFGVGDKEKLKNFRKDIHVLTLSATPIPRTLHMSLVGIRDITTIETPPLDRLPVQTIVSQFSYSLAGTALRREKARGGQSLVVYPRVENIDAFAQSLRAELGDDFRIAVVHGQMDKKLIEEVMLEFYKGTIDVLVATTLVENGIDVPNTNTLFVVSAEKLGLSQLYQLRGRVGRSDRLAWAYFTYMDEGKLTGQAYERLSVLMQYTALGSGFKIAMRDLEIRGAGNILGPEQHGQMEKVGYDMYCKILDSSIARLKGIEVKEVVPVKIEVDIDAYIPQEFITDKIQRMEVYSAIASIKSDETADAVARQIADKFGSVPRSVDGLINVARLKSKCQALGVTRVSVTKVHTSIYFNSSPEVDLMLNSANLGKFTVLKKDSLSILKCDNREIDIKSAWKQTFAILDNLLIKFSAK